MPHPDLTFDLLTLKVVSESRVTWAIYLCANSSLPKPLCSRLRPDVHNRQIERCQTDVRRASLLNAPYPRGGGIITRTFSITDLKNTK